tara:strand:+ start:12160 stop:12714 length:555 start_codon:yes stop_codon:yes gene_type:complete
MACQLTQGYATNCKDTIGGIVRIWLSDFGTLSSFTLDSDDQITDASGTATFFQYDLKNAGNTLTTTVTTSRDTGTTFFSSVLALVLPKLSKELSKELKLIAYSRPYIIVETRAGDFLFLGKDHGCELTSATLQSGGAMGDLSGYNLEFTSEEPLQPLYISGGTSTNPVAGLSSVTETITVGTNS